MRGETLDAGCFSLGAGVSPPTAEAAAWVRRWQRIGPELAALEGRRAAGMSLAEAILALEDAFESALRTMEPRGASGLVTQQQLFARRRG